MRRRRRQRRSERRRRGPIEQRLDEQRRNAVYGGKLSRWNWNNDAADDSVETTWKAVAVGSGHRCAIRTNNTLACRGSNSNGELGTGGGSVTVYTTVGVAADWQMISTGAEHTCGLRNNGELYCWGNNQDGQVGDNSAWSTVPMPVQ